MSDDSKVNIEINGIPLQASKGAMVIEVADEAGIRIPRFCYHRKLSIAANCRMCLVEVEKAPKPLPACATPVMEGMKVFTRSPKAIQAQKGTMEFLLINHPLDCPICDQGGECELQDVAMGYGSDVSQYSEGKRVVPDKDIGPLIATEMTRCIHCTRCVRFGIEIAGIQELGATGRGEHTRIGTYVASAVNSEMSGNVIDVCPVGALTAKPSRFRARAWEMTQQPAVAPHDCVGSNVHLHTLRGEVIRVVPRDNESINECWISDRDRFGYEGIKSSERLRLPMIKRDGKWQECEWDVALEAAAAGLLKVKREQGGEQLGILVSPSATVEEMYLTRKLADGLSCANIDHRLRQSDFSDQNAAPLFPSLGQPIDALELLDAVLLIGSNVRKEQPIIAHRLRKAALRGAHVMAVNLRNFEFNFNVSNRVVVGPAGMVATLAGIAKALLERTSGAVPQVLQELIASAEANTEQRAIADRLHAGERASVLLGSQALSLPHLSLVRALASLIAELSGAKFGCLSDGANASGAWLAGVLPHRGPCGQAVQAAGLDARAMFDNPRKTYLMVGVEPEFDCWDPALALSALEQADFVVSITPFFTETLKRYAHVLLPMATFAETSGTFVNAEGSWQSFAGAGRPAGEARPGWKVLRVLGNLLDLPGLEYLSSEEVRDELHRLSESADAVAPPVAAPLSSGFPSSGGTLIRISGVAAHRNDPLVRRASALQATADGQDTMLRMHSGAAERLGLAQAGRVLVRQGKTQASVPLVIDDGVPEDCVWLPAGTESSAQLGPMFGAIEVEADA